MAQPSKAQKLAEEEAAQHILERKAERKAEEAEAARLAKEKAAEERRLERERERQRIAEEKAIQRAAEKNRIKPRGVKGAPGSLENHSTARAEEVSAMMHNVARWFGRTRVTSTEELMDRAQEFFNAIAETGEMPSIEKLCLALGITTRTFERWTNGEYCDKRRQEATEQIRQALSAMEAELAMEGKIPQVVYIFRAKNFWGMKDQTDVVVTPNNPIGADVPEEELRKRIEENVIQDADFTDV